MTTFNSEQVNIARNNNLIFEFLSDFNNFQSLMPPQVSDWQSDSGHCSFNIQNMATLGMRYESKTPFNHIKIVSEGKSPFQFDLQCFLESTAENSTDVELQLNADLNMMLKMVASKPLANFINILARQLKEVCEKQLPENRENNLL
ncbi:MAG: SRPBCC family protein [Chloroflexota bacterium]